MKGKIYIIKNVENDKVYIGKTFNTIHCRFKEHIRDSRKNKTENRKLYRAIRKYGEDKFYVELIEEDIDETILNQKEIDYIKLFDSFKNGYNTTLGGDGSRYTNIDENKLIEFYKNSRSIKHTAKEFNISEDTTSLILHNNKVEIFKSNAKRIKIIDLDLEFKSIKDCERYLLNNNYTKATAENSVINNIKRSIKRNGTYLKMKFEILD